MGIVCFLEISTPTNAHVCGVGMCADIERQGNPPPPHVGHREIKP